MHNPYYILSLKNVQIVPKCAIILDANHKHTHDDVIKWKHFPRYWPFVRGIH